MGAITGNSAPGSLCKRAENFQRPRNSNVAERIERLRMGLESRGHVDALPGDIHDHQRDPICTNPGFRWGGLGRVTVDPYRRCFSRSFEDFHKLKVFSCPARVILAAAITATITLAASAQNSAGAQENGSTGWSGGSKDQPSQHAGTPGHPINPNTGKEIEVYDEQQARNQPPLATGKDLKGPPTQLAPSKTPE
jgi:hypothetical protein